MITIKLTTEQKEAAICLGLLCIVFIIWWYCRKVETFDDPICAEIHRRLIRVDPRAQKLSIKGSNQSFTEDKLRVYLCLYDENGQYYDMNMLMYVAIHELAHAISEQVDPGHKTDEFKNNFKMLLDKAQAVGVYDKKLPLNYGYCPKTQAIAKQNGGGEIPGAEGGEHYFHSH
jgi:hypothetical protein